MENVKTGRNTVIRAFLIILAACCSVCLYHYVLVRGQQISVTEQVQKEMEKDASYLQSSIEDAETPFRVMNTALEELIFQDLNLLDMFAEEDQDFEVTDKYLEDINSLLGCKDIIIADRKGNVLASANGLIKDLKNKKYDPLREVFEGKDYGIAGKGTSDSVPGAPDSMENETVSGDDYMPTLFYSMKYDDDHEFVIEMWRMTSDILDPLENAWGSLLENKTIGHEGFAFVWSNEKDSLLYYPDEDYLQKPVSALGINKDDIKDKSYMWQSVCGKRMYLYTVYDEARDEWIACAVSEDEIENSRRFNRNVLTVAFGMLAAVLAYYAILLLRQKKVKVIQDFTGSDRITSHKSRSYKLLVFTLLLTAALFLMHFYLQTLYLMSSWAESAKEHTEKIESSVGEQEVTAKMFINEYEGLKAGQINTAASFLGRNPEKAVPSMLDRISYITESYSVQIFNEDGKLKLENTSMSFPNMIPSLSSGNDSKTETGNTASEADASETGDPVDKAAMQAGVNGPVSEWMSDGRIVLSQITDKEGRMSGHLFVRYYSFVVFMALNNYTTKEALTRIQPGRNGFIFSVNPDTRKFTYFPDESLVGKDVLGYGMTKEQLRDNFCDYITVNGTTCFVVTDTFGEDLIYYAVAKKDLLAYRFRVSLFTSLIAAILFLITGLPLYTSKEQVTVVKPEEGRHSYSEDRNSPEYRTIRVLIYYVVAAAAFLAAFSAMREGAETKGVLGYVLGGTWQRGLNVFALSAAFFIMSRGALVLFVISRIVNIVGDMLPIRGGTILKMLGSLVTYVAVAFLLYQCMVCFGLNPTALMASAGIVSVVVGIGANSLVGDILAGIFLLMEGNVQVGDVVQIGDFRGYVMELGLRMTKIFDMDSDDVKIIPNNEVRNVVHMTMRSAIVYSEFQIRYEEKLESVEMILQDELKHVDNKSHLILNGPMYIGVSKLDSSGVVLKFATRCHESSRRKVEREVNHIIYSIFQRNNISVPYPQVTLHEGDDSPVER